MSQVSWTSQVYLIQHKWLLANTLQETNATNGVMIIHQQHLKVSGYTTVLRYNFSGFACLGDFIFSDFQNQFFACSAQPGQKCELGLLFNTIMNAVLQVGD